MNIETIEMRGSDYIGVCDSDGRDEVEFIKMSAANMIDDIISRTPRGRRRAIAITHIEEAVMMVVKSIFEGA